MIEKYYDQDSNLVILKSYIVRNLPHSGVCEVCELPVTEHDWIVLDINGFVVKCSETTAKIPNRKQFHKDFEFNYYVSRASNRGVIRILRDVLENALDIYEQYKTLYMGVWQLTRDEDNGDIHVRLSPDFQIDGYDDNWRRPEYTFTAAEM